MGAMQFELTAPTTGIKLVESVLHDDRAEIVLACDPSLPNAPRQGNFVFLVTTERPNNGNAAPNRSQRTPVGFVPAIPFEIVAR
jgi:hypothetical protein